MEKLSALDADYKAAVDGAAHKTVLLATVSRSAIWWMITV